MMVYDMLIAFFNGCLKLSWLRGSIEGTAHFFVYGVKEFTRKASTGLTIVRCLNFARGGIK